MKTGQGSFFMQENINGYTANALELNDIDLLQHMTPQINQRTDNGSERGGKGIGRRNVRTPRQKTSPAPLFLLAKLLNAFLYQTIDGTQELAEGIIIRIIFS